MSSEPAQRDWQNEARFWQLKYFELQAHTSQVIGALGRSQITETITNALAQQAAAQQNPVEGAGHGKLGATAVAVNNGAPQ